MGEREKKLIDISAEYPFHSPILGTSTGKILGYALCDANGGWNIVRLVDDDYIVLYNPYTRKFYDAQREEIEEIYV